MVAEDSDFSGISGATSESGVWHSHFSGTAWRGGKKVEDTDNREGVKAHRRPAGGSIQASLQGAKAYKLVAFV